MRLFQKIQSTHPEILDIFKDKRVCLVAGGPVDNEGEAIDNNYDVVVRINNIHYQFPLSDDVKKSHGSRCDILFREHHQIWGIMNEMGDKNYVNILKQIGVNKVIMWDGIGTSDEMVGRINKSGDIPCYQLRNTSGIYEWLKGFFDEEHVIPTTGLMAIATIGLCKPKSFNLYGFTFSYDFIHDNIYYPKGNEKKPNDFKKGSMHKHRHKREFEIFIKDIWSFFDIKVDRTMFKFINGKIQEKGTCDNFLLHNFSE